MYFEVENFKDFEEEGELEVECDQEFIDFSKDQTGLNEAEEAVEETVNNILREEIEKRKEEG